MRFAFFVYEFFDRQFGQKESKKRFVSLSLKGKSIDIPGCSGKKGKTVISPFVKGEKVHIFYHPASSLSRKGIY